VTFYTVRPLVDFTVFKRTGKRRPNPFPKYRWSWPTTLSDLKYELGKLDATDVVMQIACTPEDLRLDGMLRANVKVAHPGVVLSFTSKHGPLSYATDTFEGRWLGDPPNWQINTRAIALGLEALRKIDRYGIGAYGQQYAGYKALPAGTGDGASHMTISQAESLITSIVGAFDRSDGHERWRRARVMVHPDRRDGDRTLWDQVEQAGVVLGLVDA
jgi:hypothetical protein